MTEIEIGKTYLASQNNEKLLIFIHITYFTSKAVGYIAGDNDVIGYKVLKKEVLFPSSSREALLRKLLK